MIARDLISKKTRNEFREYLVIWTLREIANEFSAAELEPKEQFTSSFIDL